MQEYDRLLFRIRADQATIAARGSVHVTQLVLFSAPVKQEYDQRDEHTGRKTQQDQARGFSHQGVSE